MKSYKHMSTDAKHVVNNPRGTPIRWRSRLSKPNEQQATHAKQMVNNSREMPLLNQMHVKDGSDF